MAKVVVPEALWEKLERGCDAGTTLTPKECVTVLELLPRPRGSLTCSLAYLQRGLLAAQEFARHRAAGDKTKVATAKVMERFGISRSQVFAARKRYPVNIEALAALAAGFLIVSHHGGKAEEIGAEPDRHLPDHNPPV